MAINLRQIANNATSTINPNTVVTIRQSDGYTIGAGRKQIPVYLPDETGPAQIQAATNEMLRHIEGLNLQATYKHLYFNPQLFAAVNLTQKGGDLIIIDGETWLTVQVLERWSNWCKVLICLQSP